MKRHFAFVVLLLATFNLESNQTSEPRIITTDSQASCPAASLIEPCTCRVAYKETEPSITCQAIPVGSLAEVLTKLKQTNQTLHKLTIAGIDFPSHTFPARLLDQLAVRRVDLDNHAFPSNRLISIEDGAFARLLHNTQISLGDNNFTQIPNAVKNLSALTTLFVSNNPIKSLGENAFQGLNSLEELSLYQTPIGYFHPRAFDGIAASLTTLNLGSDGSSASVPSEALRGLKALKTLSLYHNKIQTIRPDDFSQFQSAHVLQELNLALNSIKTLEANVFIQLQSLETLSLQLNNISTIADAAFAGLYGTLKYLKLDSNELREVPTVALRNFTKLVTLDLSGNRIGTIRRDAFQGGYAHTLKHLMLKTNRIETIENGAFDNLHSIEMLTLDDNRLKRIGALPEGLLSQVSYLPLRSNPFECSCELRWYPRWIARRWPNARQEPSVVWRSVECVLPAGTNATNDSQLLTPTVHQLVKLVYLEDIDKHLQCPAA